MKELSAEDFTSALNKEDDLGMVIRAHIHIEHRLERYLALVVTHYEKYQTQITPDYETKINLALAMGLSEELRSVLKSLGTLRNRFAHQPNQSLKKSDADNVYSALSSAQKELFQETFKATSEQFAWSEKRFSQLAAEKKLGLLFLFVWSSLGLACRKLSARA